MSTKFFDYSSIGKTIGEMEVIISYNIINLFSGHLYSSPIKAIEELVVNSYDAFAKNCHILIPENLEDADAKIVVFDDGEGMDEDGMRELWLIAETRKRDSDREEESLKKGRLPVGKFGIGKLASYVIGRRITHLSKKDGRYYAVTMDYKDLEEKKDQGRHILHIRETDRSSALKLLEDSGIFDLSIKEPENWTLVAVDMLKPRAREIQRGRLRWVISTALPLVPDFECFLNGDLIKPSKLSETILREWTIGEDDKSAKTLGYEFSYDEAQKRHVVSIPEIGKVWGKMELYESTITTGKSAELGRSNGFFVMVRGRLINQEKSLFGLPILSHATFNRFRAVIHADGLDGFLVVDREDVSQKGHEYLESYLSKKFYEIRDWYDKYQEKVETKYPEGVSELPVSLIKYPLIHASDRIQQEELTPFLIKRPDPSEEMQDTISEIEPVPLDPDEPVAILDINKGVIKTNTQHPIRINFQNDKGFENWAIAEAMLEVYLLESGINPAIVQSVLKKRDRLLRVLVQKGPRPIGLVSKMLVETGHIQEPFEIACGDSFAILGLEITRLGGKGKPEGIGVASLGVDRSGKKLTYKIVYDAKSTSKERVKASNLNMSSTCRHRDDWNANYAAIIAPDFEGDSEDSAAYKEARELKVTLVRARDLAKLVRYSAVKSLSLRKLEKLFETCRTPDDSEKWVQDFVEESVPVPPLKVLLDTIWQLQHENPKDPPSFGAIKQRRLDVFREYSETRDIGEWLRALSRLVPKLIYVSEEDKSVILEQKPEVVIERIIAATKEIEVASKEIMGTSKE